VPPLKKTENEIEWTGKKAQTRERIAQLGPDEDYEPEVVYAALLGYLHRNLGQELWDEFLSAGHNDRE